MVPSASSEQQPFSPRSAVGAALWTSAAAKRPMMMMMVAVRVAALAGWCLASAGARPLKVAYLHQGLPVGGVESSLVNICRHADRFRLSPVLVLFGRDGGDALLEDALRGGCEVARFGARWREADWSISWDGGEVDRLAAYLSDENFDVAFTFYGGPELGEPTPLGIAAAQRARLPVVTRIEWAAAAPPGLGIAAVEVSTPFVARLQLLKGVRYPLHLVGANGIVEARPQRALAV